MASKPEIETVLFIDGCSFHRFGELGFAQLDLYGNRVHLSFETKQKVKVKDSEDEKSVNPRKTDYKYANVKRHLALDNPEVSITIPAANERVIFSLDKDFKALLQGREQQSQA